MDGSDDGVERHCTARHLDNPTPIFFGLGLLQLLSAVLAIGIAYEAYAVTGFLSSDVNSPSGQLRVGLVVTVWLLFAGAGYLQFAGKVEPFLIQMVKFMFRRKRFRSRWVDRGRYE